MTENAFRRLALAMPQAVEGEHMDHPDFRIKGKIFATLMPITRGRKTTEFGMIKLTPEQQARFVKESPSVFSPVPGGWGVRGATRVRLAGAEKSAVRRAMAAAWCNAAPKRMVEELSHTLITGVPRGATGKISRGGAEGAGPEKSREKPSIQQPAAKRVRK